MAFLELEKLTKSFGAHNAVDGLTLGVEKGEFVALLGPSGCGKTTTLQMIAGFVEPTSGAIRLGGKDLLAIRPAKRGLGIVFQSYALFPHMTVAENVGFGLEMQGVGAAERRTRVGETLELVGLGAFASRFPRQMSGGQQQRVALARALVIRPQILLLDEPLSNLDAKLREGMQIELRQIQRTVGTTTILVTHDQAEAMALGDRIVVMEHGRVAQIGKPRDIYQRPATRFVAEFIGTMKRLTGSVSNGTFTCKAGDIAWAQAPATATEILFRPEDIRVVESGEATGLKGTVAAAFFLGDRTRLFVDVGEAQPLVIESTARRDFSHGDPVGLAIDPRGLLVL